MLRLWRERLLASLASTEVSWLRLGGAFKPKVLAKRTVRVDPAYGPEPWQGAVAALRSEAEALRLQHTILGGIWWGARLTLTTG